MIARPEGQFTICYLFALKHLQLLGFQGEQKNDLLLDHLKTCTRVDKSVAAQYGQCLHLLTS